VLVLSRAPAHVIDEVPVGLPRPRDVDRLVTTPGFAGLFERIRVKLA
jgi:hypothetical protein